MQIIAAFLSGLVMAGGLILSGMVNPKKVIGFLDLFGSFDPTLAFVMAGALIVTMLGYRLIKSSSKPLLYSSFEIPTNTKIDFPLIAGAIIFGTGWGLVGFCPAPAIVGIGLNITQAYIFVIAMLLGMFIARKFKG